MRSKVIETNRRNKIKLADLEDAIKTAVLRAIDEVVRAKTGRNEINGWTDGELPALFRQGVEPFIAEMAERIGIDK